MAKAARATGRTNTNMKRQVKCSRISPETVGPMAGATEMAMLTLPMTAPRRSIGTRVRMVVIRSGSMMAVPPAWTMRASSSTSNPGASAARSVPPENRPMASMNTARVDSRLQDEPGGGDDHGHGEHKARGEPLHRGGVDPEVHHEPLEGDVHDGFVEDDHEGGNQQGDDDGDRLAGHLHRAGAPALPQRRGPRDRRGRWKRRL